MNQTQMMGEGRTRMRNNKYTISDVAKQMDVSRATVSRALSNAPGVGPALRQKIIDYADEIGYRPNSIAKSLSTGRMNTIGLIYGDVRNPFYADLTYYMQKAFDQKGYAVMVFNSEYSVEKELEFIRMAEEFCLAGLVLFTAQTNMEEANFKDVGIPIVFVNRSLAMEQYDCVLMDNFKAGYIAAMHLIKLGHRRIGMVKGNALSSASMLRFDGVVQALKNCGLSMLPEDVWSGDLKMPTGYAMARRFFAQPSRPDGLVISNDMMALGFIDYCNEIGVKIPEEISIVSFDNIIFSGIHGIDLTTISQDVQTMGEKAAELMLERIEHPQGECKKIILEPTLIVRRSTRAYEE